MGYGYGGINYGYGGKNTVVDNIAMEEPTPNESSFGATGNVNIDVVLEGSKWEFLNGADRISDWGISDGSAQWLSETVVFKKSAMFLMVFRNLLTLTLILLTIFMTRKLRMHLVLS